MMFFAVIRPSSRSTDQIQAHSVLEATDRQFLLHSSNSKEKAARRVFAAFHIIVHTSHAIDSIHHIEQFGMARKYAKIQCLGRDPESFHSGQNVSYGFELLNLIAG